MLITIEAYLTTSTIFSSLKFTVFDPASIENCFSFKLKFPTSSKSRLHLVFLRCDILHSSPLIQFIFAFLRLNIFGYLTNSNIFFYFLFSWNAAPSCCKSQAFFRLPMHSPINDCSNFSNITIVGTRMTKDYAPLPGQSLAEATCRSWAIRVRHCLMIRNGSGAQTKKGSNGASKSDRSWTLSSK